MDSSENSLCSLLSGSLLLPASSNIKCSCQNMIIVALNACQTSHCCSPLSIQGFGIDHMSVAESRSLDHKHQQFLIETWVRVFFFFTQNVNIMLQRSKPFIFCGERTSHLSHINVNIRKNWLTGSFIICVCQHRAQFDIQHLNYKTTILKDNTWQGRYLLLCVVRWGTCICKSTLNCPTNVLKYTSCGTVPTRLWGGETLCLNFFTWEGRGLCFSVIKKSDVGNTWAKKSDFCLQGEHSQNYFILPLQLIWFKTSSTFSPLGHYGITSIPQHQTLDAIRHKQPG